MRVLFNLAVSLLGGAAIFFAAIWLIANTAHPGCSPQEAEQIHAETEAMVQKWTIEQTDKTIRSWLDDLRKGRDGNQHWLASMETIRNPFRLYAVTEYEIVDAPSPNKRVVRIHSANRLGQPIVALYTVTMFNSLAIESVVRHGDTL